MLLTTNTTTITATPTQDSGDIYIGIGEAHGGEWRIEGNEVVTEMYACELWTGDDSDTDMEMGILNGTINPRSQEFRNMRQQDPNRYRRAKQRIQEYKRIWPSQEMGQNDVYEAGYVLWYDPNKKIRVPNAYTPETARKTAADSGGSLYTQEHDYQTHRDRWLIDYRQNPLTRGWDAPETDV
jgi:hypothetical protein